METKEKRKQNLVESLNRAVEGFIYAMKTQRNMRLHFLIATLVIVLGIYLGVSKLELLLLLGAITLVLTLEMVNTAAEVAIDLIEVSYHPVARTVKDLTAGAVFLTALNAICVGYIIFSWHFKIRIEEGVKAIASTPWHITFIVLIVVLFIVVLGKVLFHRGTPFRGGMPSGHAAFAYAMWTIIVFSTQNGLIIVLSFIMAFLIARNRLKDRIHNVWEIITGALLGTLVTALVFQLMP